MMDNPGIWLNICPNCCGSGETGLGFHQECEVCNGLGTASKPDEPQTVEDTRKANERTAK